MQRLSAGEGRLCSAAVLWKAQTTSGVLPLPSLFLLQSPAWWDRSAEQHTQWMSFPRALVGGGVEEAFLFAQGRLSYS